MGYITHAGNEYEIDDRCLAHLKVVVGSKLRRRESFFLNLSTGTRYRPGTVALWISPNGPLEFRFAGSRVPPLNENWILAMRESACTPRGIVLMSEAAADARAVTRGSAGR